MVKNLRKIEVFAIFMIIIIFLALGNKYIINGLFEEGEIGIIYNNTKTRIIDKFTPEEKIVCTEGQVKISVEGGDLCRKKVDSKDYQYLEIFDTYSKTVNEKEIIYDFLDEGDIEIANAYLNNEIKIERYESVELEKITWEEDPYNERYWRFIFYSLRETRHLLYAYKETGDERYRDKLVGIIESFIDEGVDKPHAWDDYHGVAFRTMTLTNTWWKLREQNALSIETSEKILQVLERHGEFLFDEEHYEHKYNHGISQMAALFILSVNFPELENADKWLEVAKTRLNDGVNTLVDDDGVLVENSPYYHFYTLEKYFLIHKFTIKHNIDVGSNLGKIVDKMISYATYILQPNLEVPLLGASLERKVGKRDALEEMAKENSEFLYVLTQGKDGEKPKELNRYYPTTGQVIMRSDWEKKTKFENKFEDQTQIIFDVGPYRTAHSDLDALSFVLYSNGKTLLEDTGLYTYEFEDSLKAYFHGTRGHNTILVDGQDQRVGAPTPGKFKEGDGYVVQSGQHDLYPQINHQRLIALFGHDFVLIVDRLISEKEHSYEQLFHLFPEAKIEKDGTTLTARGEEVKEKLVIRQLLPHKIELSSVIGDEETGNGFCSSEYENKIPCYMLSYKQKAKNASFVTLLEIGNNNGYISSKIKDGKISIRTKDKIYDIDINELDVSFTKESRLSEKIIGEHNLKLQRINENWQLVGNNAEKFILEDKDKKLIIIPKNRDEKSIFVNRLYYEVNIDGVDTYYSIEQNIFTDIPFGNNQKEFKIYEQEDFLPILGYHHIIADDKEITHPTLEMHVSDFEKQIGYLTNEMGCRWFTFGDIMENYVLKGIKTPKRTCVMNFDDGRKNHFTQGYETFKKYGAVATFYIITDRSFRIGSPNMNVTDTNELYRNGNEIGSHTVSASSLVSDGYNHDELEYQLKISKDKLNEQGYKVTTFAYPRGEDTKEIVELTKKHYLAGRDVVKFNSWRDRRPLTASFDKDYVWHMNYHKPETETLKELKISIGYNNWWQFEEGCKLYDKGNNDSIRTLSSVDPTKNSFAVVHMEDIGDKVSNKFIVSEDNNYVIEIYGVVNTENELEYSTEPTMSIYIDSSEKEMYKNQARECRLYKEQYYCFYNVSVSLTEGQHVLTVEANERNVNIDKFRIYRSINVKNSYDIKIKELKRILPREHPHQIEIKIDINKRTPIWGWILLSVMIVLIGYFGLKKLKK